MANIDVVREIYAAMAARDVDRLLALVHPDCVYTQDPALPWGGRHEGHDGVITFALALTEAIDSAVTIEAMFEADDRVFQYGRTKGTVRGTGVPFDIPEVHAWTIKDGKAIAADFAIDTQAMLAALAREPGATS